MAVALAAVAVLALVGGGAFLYFVDWNRFKGFADAQGSRAAGRSVTIDGDLSVKFRGRLAEVHAERVRLANADWAREPNFLEIEVVDFQLDLLELLRGRTVLPELTLTKPMLSLEKRDARHKNWDMAPASPGNVAVKTTVPQKRTEIPIVGRLGIDDGVLTVIDVRRSCRCAR
jgi:AsmA family protein